ncbi:uncharacterized protein BDZ99DRAFT_404154 [Mytilinidion resinicola]|uniref:Uncharacterized protein n=1 Tax=Mytilinidion resinicola TaxID=574789 RepID=A0A6A6Z877_9PEZI|nr:uncharacterized protein BDZ99DRAFT_404154 [Mytilinidion resinicola]KAF2816919.1 hypothetical protein BDZ99DRAFT_404154 [Mytilinidion resinicola]
MNGNTTKVDDISIAIEKISISSCSSSLSTLAVKEEGWFPYDIDASLFSRQPWICKTDSVRHRLRGILITHDTYDLFRLSFESDSAARHFLGELLVAMSTSGLIQRMSELQLEELNSHWDETARTIHPQFEPVNLPVLVAFGVAYSLSSQWQIIKTLYYIALSQEILDTLYEDAICNLPLNPLNSAKYTPMVKDIPYLRQSQQRCSAELELKKALEYSSSLKPEVNPPIIRIVNRLIDLSKIGRRERSEPFLNLSETTIPRAIPRESMENLCQAIKVVRFEEPGPDKTPHSKTRGMRVFLFRRLVGTIGKSGLDKALAKSFQESTTVITLIDKGNAPNLQLDNDADGLLSYANKCNLRKADGDVHESTCEGIAGRMFSN